MTIPADRSHALDNDTVGEIRRALLDHRVIFIRWVQPGRAASAA
jgi:hypothetical protein